MRLVIDMQGAQTASRHRGIGRYTMSLVRLMARDLQQHEVVLLLNGLFPETIDPIRAAFAQLLAPQQIAVFQALPSVHALSDTATARREASELAREAFLRELNPDMVLLTSLFEGYGDDAITSIGRLPTPYPVTVLLHDLIPLINPDAYLANERMREWYLGKIDQLRRADFILANSSSTASEAVHWIGFDPDRVANVLAACDESFVEQAPTVSDRQRHAARWGIDRPFALYTTAGDVRKNNHGLIEAWAALPKAIRQEHQLVLLSSSISGGLLGELEATARRAGMGAQDVRFVGNATDDDLRSLYNACKAFVFPSWHEGFGLPVLEAMACGRAVIAGNRTSIPEVVGREDALFDPFVRADITDKLLRVLSDDRYRQDLERHARARVHQFSWARTAEAAWESLQRFSKMHVGRNAPVAQPPHRPRLLYVQAGHRPSAPLTYDVATTLEELSRHYAVDLLESPGLDSARYPFCRSMDRDGLRASGAVHDRVVYHLGPDGWTPEFLALMAERPGLVLLEDPMLADHAARYAASGRAPARWVRAFLARHGWADLRAWYEDPGSARVPPPTLPELLPHAQGFALPHARPLRPPDVAEARHGVPPTSAVSPPCTMRPAAKTAARRALGLPDEEFIVCVPASTLELESARLLARAWQKVSPEAGRACRLVITGAVAPGVPADSELAGVSITGPVPEQTLQTWLDCADVGLSIGLQPGAASIQRLLQMLSGGLATIANLRPELVDGLDAAVQLLPSAPTAQDLADALLSLAGAAVARDALQERARRHLARAHGRRRFGELLQSAIEASFAADRGRRTHETARLIGHAARGLTLNERIDLATALARNHPPAGRRRQLLLDVSELAQRDARSGIQRVVRSLLAEVLTAGFDDWDIQPVLATHDSQGYRYAHRFCCRFLGLPDEQVEDAPVEAWPGDQFFGLDFQADIVFRQRATLQEWHRRGVRLMFLVHDLLPFFRPEFFGDGARLTHHRWLQTISEFDGAVCVSRTVADEFLAWLDVFGPERARPFAMHWSHNGADIGSSVPTRGVPPGANELIAELSARTTLLMVGTVEPRKAHAQALSAFEILWRSGVEANLVIVGKQGWKVEELAERLRNHPEKGRRLHWLEGISDEFLETVYRASDGLVAASFGEGFGLPLIEAAQHQLPLICRDLPVFHEVAGEHATYFPDSARPDDLARCLADWIPAAGRGTQTPSTSLAWVTWRQSAAKLIEILRGAPGYRNWLPRPGLRFWGNDPRFTSEVGRYRGQTVESNGQAGFLLYGPYIALDAGEYRLTLRIEGRSLSPEDWVEVCKERATHRIRLSPLTDLDLRGPLHWTISLHEPTSDLELRVWVGAGSDVTVVSLDIEPAAPPTTAPPPPPRPR